MTKPVHRERWWPTDKPFEAPERQRARASWVPWLLAQQAARRNTHLDRRVRIAEPAGREWWLTLSGFYALQEAEAMSTELPKPTGWSDVEPNGSVPYWEIHMGQVITAWNEGVEIDGALHEGEAVEWLREDALAMLAAIEQHEQFAAKAAP